MASTASALNLSQVLTPAFIVDKELVERNCKQMIETAKALGVSLRPHMKTHKTIEVGKLQLGEEFHSVVVSTLAEAKFYADAGFHDVLYGVPLAPQKIPIIVSLNSLKDVRCHIIIDNPSILPHLRQEFQKEGSRAFSVFLATDCGYHREGLNPSSDEFLSLAKSLSSEPTFEFQGIYAHSGHSYSAKTPSELRERIEEERDGLSSAAKRLRELGIPCKHISMGSTPVAMALSTILHSDPSFNLGLVTEIHPGNYVFLDRQQVELGAVDSPSSHVQLKDVAVTVLSTVISHYSDRKLIMIDAGSLALSKDTCASGGYGAILNHPELRIARVSQEVSLVERIDGGDIDFCLFPIGSRVRIVPNHSCLTAALFPEYQIVDGRVDAGERVVDRWIPIRGW